jgi:hypothetical protein
MLVIRSVDPAEALPLFWDIPPSARIRPSRWRSFCQRLGVVALAAEEDGELAGFAVAESNARVVHFLNLEGGTDACRLLLTRLVMLAGERDMSGWCPAARPDVREMLEDRGFDREAQDDIQGRPSHLYRWRRNEDVRG